MNTDLRFDAIFIYILTIKISTLLYLISINTNLLNIYIDIVSLTLILTLYNLYISFILSYIKRTYKIY